MQKKINKAKPQYIPLHKLFMEQYGSKYNPKSIFWGAPIWFKYQVNYKLVNTRQLLWLFHQCRSEHWYYYEDYIMEYNTDYSMLYEQQHPKIYNALKQELALREHIPNKKEGKILRRKMAQQGK